MAIYNGMFRENDKVKAGAYITPIPQQPEVAGKQIIPYKLEVI